MEFPKKWPKKSQWRQFFKVLNKKEKIAFFFFLFLAIGAFFYLLIEIYYQNTEIQPAIGGEYSEGLLGQPRFLNPVYAIANDVDRDLVQLLFSGLMKYNLKGEIVPDLAKDYRILEDGKVYEFDLKENIFWQDGKEITVDDVIFTVETIQDSDYKSPLRGSWLGVKAEKVSEKTVRFKLDKSSGVFLENCTLKIIPKHIWKEISPENFPLSFYNLKPISSGPYKLEKISQSETGKITSLTLVTNQRYFGKKPNIPKITFYFYETENDLIAACLTGQIKGFTISSIENLQKCNLVGNFYSFSLPRYFAVFFNLKNSKLFSDKNIREAFALATDKRELITKILLGKGKVVDSPILPEIYNFSAPSKTYEFNLEKAKTILDKEGFIEKENGFRERVLKKKTAFQFKSDLQLGSKGEEVKELQKCLSSIPDVYQEGQITGYFGSLTKKAVIRFQEKYQKDILEPLGLKKGTGKVGKLTREKLNDLCNTEEEILPLKFTLKTVDEPLLVKTASLLKSQWEKIGADVEIETFEISTFKREILPRRDYEALLFGELLGQIPDPYPFWHSSQTKDPGLNLSLYENQKCDKLLVAARQNLDEKGREEKLVELQEIIIEDIPAIFLFNPNYIYYISPEIKGVKNNLVIADPSKRFSDVENWYIMTKRVIK